MSREPVEYLKIKVKRMIGLRRNQPHLHRYWLTDDEGNMLFVICSDKYVGWDQADVARERLREVNLVVGRIVRAEREIAVALEQVKNIGPTIQTITRAAREAGVIK
jgi:hypothetical protein